MNSNNKYDINGLGCGSIVTVGMFDGVHRGHQHLLGVLKERAQTMNLEPVVVTFDRHPREVLGLGGADFRVLTDNEERRREIASCGIKHIETICFTEEMARLSACQFARQMLIGNYGMKALVLGYDNQFGNKQNNDFEQLPQLAQESGFEIFTDTAVMLFGVEVSSTKIRQALSIGDVERAEQMLGRPYRLVGRVVHGRGVGHTIGFPTANVEIADPRKAVPPDGVYAVEVRLGDSSVSLRAMANVGPQPTFGCQVPTLEVYLLDWDGDAYDVSVEVSFRKRLRDTRRFGSVEELVAQLEIDKQKVKEL